MSLNKNSKNVMTNFLRNSGSVVSVVDGIVTIKGLDNAKYGEMVGFAVGSDIVRGIVLNLTFDFVNAVVLGDESQIKPGNLVVNSGHLMRVPTSKSLLGRVIDPAGNVLDGLGPLKVSKFRNIEQNAASIISRAAVNVPMETGLKVVDSTVPIGNGQRELIIGDSKTGKTSVALDTIINQKGSSLICIYVAIGQKRSSVARIHKTLGQKGCLTNTIIVAATASDSAASQYIAPYSGCSIGEYFMDKGLDVLIVYDDLSKHAVAYRQLSLLLRRPPGREGYPGDVFFTHSRLLERAANLSGDKGSLTALPVIETIQGDVAAYVPTNVISITDGQIFLEKELFSRGIRPAVSPGISVSRVGSAAQSKTIKNLASTLKLDLAQFREVEDFARLGFTLDEATTRLIDKGTKLTKALVQKRFAPVKIHLQILFLHAVLNSYLDSIAVDLIPDFERELFNYVNLSMYSHPLEYHMRRQIPPYIAHFLLDSFVLYFLSFYVKK